MSTYELRDVKVTLQRHTILDVPHLHLNPQSLVAIAGPNGAGKSTLLSVLSGLWQQFDGSCSYLGKEMRSWSRRELSRKVTVVMQSHPVTFPFSVEDVVLMGRTPHAQGWFESPDDLSAAYQALEKTDSLYLKDRKFSTLSGGEQQRVILAAALAQEPEVLLLDEPSSFLDLTHQIQLYKLLTKLSNEGILVLVITHDLNLAAAYASRLILLDEGRIVADGAPQEVITTESMKNVFHVDTELHRTESGGIWMRYGF